MVVKQHKSRDDLISVIMKFPNSEREYPKTYQLPKVMKRSMILSLTEEEIEILLTLCADTTRTKKYFNARNQMATVLGLKRKGFLKADSLNNNYYYCLTGITYWLIDMGVL